jgi:hypothetical protein
MVERRVNGKGMMEGERQAVQGRMGMDGPLMGDEPSATSGSVGPVRFVWPAPQSLSGTRKALNWRRTSFMSFKWQG